MCVSTLMFSMALIGCTLFERNVAAFNNMVVASVGSGDNAIHVTKRQLLDAYNQFGHQWAQQLGLEGAINRTLDVVIEREILASLAISDSHFGSNHGNHGHTDGTRALTESEAAQARQAVFNAMDNHIQTISNEIRGDSLTANLPDAPDNPAVTHPVFEPFQPYIVRHPHDVVTVHNPGTPNEWTETRRYNFRLDLSRFEEVTFYTDVPSIDAYLVTAFEPRGGSLGEARVMEQTLGRIARHLRNREQGLWDYYPQDHPRRGQSTENISVIRFELNRMILEQETTILVNRFRETYEMGINDRDGFDLFMNRGTSPQAEQAWRNHTIRGHNTYVNNLAFDAQDHFKREVRIAHDRYRRGFDTHDSIRNQIIRGHDDGRPGLTDLYFIPESIIHQFFTVSHILIPFPDMEGSFSREMQRIEQQYAQDGNTANRDAAIIAHRARATVHDRNPQGEEIGNPISASRVMEIVTDTVNRGANPQERINLFHGLIYRFNTDPGMFNASFEYTMGADIRPRNAQGNLINPTAPDNMSGMIEEFTDASRALFDFDLATGRPRGQVGSMYAQLVWGQFGAHIIMYTRNLSDFIFTDLNGSMNLLEDTFQNFLFQTKTSYGNQTFFDTIVANLTRHSYDRAERSLIHDFKRDLAYRDQSVTIFTHRFSHLWS